MRNKGAETYYNLMMVPALALLFTFSIVPMFGIIIAFQKFVPAKGVLGSRLVGLANFQTLFTFPDVGQVFYNTIFIAVFKIILGIIVPVLFALVLNETPFHKFKRVVQTIAYLPYFLSWVVLAVIFSNVFSYTGMVNGFLGLFGAPPRMLMIDNSLFRPILISTDVWRNFGFSAIIYLAAITAIDPGLYEAAHIDGATRFQTIRLITLPSIVSTIVLLATLSLGNVLNAGFDQIFVMYTPLTYKTADIIDTYVYRMGLVNLQYSFATAVGLLKSVVSFVLIVVSYVLADRYAGYRIF
jgi:putative aldouronate transport system permease protein